MLLLISLLLFLSVWYIFCIAPKEQERVTNVERALKKRSKELMPKMKQERFRAITLQGAIAKSLILPWQY